MVEKDSKVFSQGQIHSLCSCLRSISILKKTPKPHHNENPTATKNPNHHEQKNLQPHKTSPVCNSDGQREHASLGAESYVKCNSFFQLCLPLWLLYTARNLPLTRCTHQKELTSPCSFSSCQIAGSHSVGDMLSLGSSWFTLDNCQPVFSSK